MKADNPEHQLFYYETVTLLAESLINALEEQSPTQAHSIAALEMALLCVGHPPLSVDVFRRLAA